MIPNDSKWKDKQGRLPGHLQESNTKWFID